MGEGMIDENSAALSRRDLLIYSGMALGVELLQPVAAIAAGIESALRPGELFCATLGYNPPSVTRQMAVSEGESTVAVWSGAGKAKAKTFLLPFAPHSYIPSRRTPTEIIAISKWGRQIAIFDLITGVVGRVVNAGEGRRFFGHGVLSPDGRHIFITEHDDHMLTGMITKRELASLSVVDEFQTFGGYPHDVRLAGAGDQLLVVNSGYMKTDPSPKKPVPGHSRLSNLSWLTHKDGKLVEQVAVEYPISLTHLKVAKDETIVASGMLFPEKRTSSPATTAVWVKRKGEAGRSLYPTENLKSLFVGEGASLIIDEKRELLLLATRRSPVIFYFNYRTGRCLKECRLSAPRSIEWCRDMKDIVVVDPARSELLRVDSVTQQVLHAVQIDALKNDSGPHLLRLDT